MPGRCSNKGGKNAKSRVRIHNNRSLFQMPVRLWASFFLQTALLCSSRKDGKFWTAVIGVSCYFLFGMTIFTNDMFNVTLDLLWFTALMLVAFKGRALPKLCVGGYLLSAGHLIKFSHPGSVGCSIFIFRCHTFASIFCYLSDAFLHILFWYVLYRLFRQRLYDFSRLFDQNTWILLGAVCLASLVSITTVIYYAPAQSPGSGYAPWPASLPT